MSIAKLKAKHEELIKQLAEDSTAYKATKYVLQCIADIRNKQLLIRNLETDAHYADDDFKCALLSAAWDLKH